MIKHISLAELNEFRKKDDHKTHNHEYENVFLFHPAQGLLNSRAYKLCKLCGKMVQIQIDDKINKEISAIIDRKMAV